MSKFFHIALLGLFLINCTSNTIIKKPDNLMSKDEMANILTDMFLASEKTGNMLKANTKNKAPINPPSM